MRPVILVVALALGACGEPPPPRPRPPANAEEKFAAALAEAACTGVAGCCSAKKLGAFDQPTCETLVRGSVDAVHRLRAEQGGGVLDERNAAACLAKVKRYAGACVDPDRALGLLDASPCDQVFTGGLSPGKACQVSEQCALSMGATRAVCGESKTCEGLRPAAADEPCTGECDDDGCTDRPKRFTGSSIEAACEVQKNLTCDPDQKKCRPRAAEGTACDDKHACAQGLYCRDKKCAPKGPLASSCDKAKDACASELLCDAGSKTCVAKKQVTESCSEDADCATANCAGHVCRKKDDVTMLRLGRSLKLFCEGG